jgi:hypothetical protein
MGVRIYLPNALYLQGQALLGLNQKKTGHKCLQTARIEAEAIGSRPSLWPILFSLSQLEDDPAEAQALHQQSQKIVEYIADNAPTAELKASFLALPNVAAVFEPIRNE